MAFQSDFDAIFVASKNAGRRFRLIAFCRKENRATPEAGNARFLASSCSTYGLPQSSVVVVSGVVSVSVCLLERRLESPSRIR